MANVFGNNLIHSVNGKIGKVVVKEDANYIHVQASPSDYWVMPHNLNKKVSIGIEDTAGTTIRGEIIKNNGQEVIVAFNFSFSGEAYFN